MTTKALKTNADLFTEKEIDFDKTLGKLTYLDKRDVPDYEYLVFNLETGEPIPGVLVDETTHRIVEGTLPEGVKGEVRQRPIDGTISEIALVLYAENFGNQIEITVPLGTKVETLLYNKEIRLTGLTAYHWTRTTRQQFNGQTTYTHTHGFKLRAENAELVKNKAAAETVKGSKKVDGN